ncbi:MAG: hypothetical protein AAF608_05105 [Pseudomonadota bacterium]
MERPIQGKLKGKRVAVMFDYDSSTTTTGVVLRDDITEPFLTLIQLEDGFVVRSTECQYSPIPLKQAKEA